MPVAHAAGDRFHQFGVRDAVEVAAQIRVDHLGMSRVQQAVDVVHGIQRAATRSIGVLLRLQIGLEDRLEDQHRRHLHNTILDRRDAQRALLAVRFGDVNPSHRPGMIGSISEFLDHFVEPPVQAIRLDVLETLAIDPRRAVVVTATDVGELQDVATIHLVVQRIEPIARRSLRFGVQRLLEFLNLRWR